jgi:hypothetical protein
VRWGVFIVFLFVALVLDTGFFGVMKIAGVVPAVTPCVAVFVAMSAPRHAALAACLVIGVVLDLTTRISMAPDRGIYFIGPWALGHLVGCHLMLPLRTMVFRRNPLTMGVMTLFFLVIASTVAVAALLVRSCYPEVTFYWQGETPLRELLARWGWATYCAILAVPTGWLLARTAPLWGFHPSVQRSGRW